jgi:hypothetical protein
MNYDPFLISRIPMAETSVFEDLYQEELYSIPARTLILIDRPWQEVGEDQKTLLNKILGSVKLSIATVQILHSESLSVNDLLPLNPGKIVSFGVELRPVQKKYEYVPVDGLHIIISDSLSSLDDTRKKNLWLALRQMFGI